MKALAQIQIDGRTFKLGDFSEYAPLKSPAFTGTPTAPTKNKDTKSTSIATTAFVHSVVADYTKTADLGSLATKSSITHSEVSDWDTATASFLTEHQSLTAYAKKADLGDLASLDTITHSKISDWASATSSFLTEHQDISGLLAKTGGTMSGVITRNGVLAQSGNTSGSITIQNGTAASGGGGIWMYGASHTNKGKVRLQAYDSTHKKYCALDANGDGTLTWCGNTVATTDYVDAAIAAITDADSTGY